MKNIKNLTSIRTKKDVLNIIRPNGEWLGKTGSSERIRLFKGSQKEGWNVFNKLTENGKLVASDKKINVYKLSDNTHITYRPISKSGPPTIDIKIPEFKGNIKLKFIE
jgi:hypothetical protein